MAKRTTPANEGSPAAAPKRKRSTNGRARPQKAEASETYSAAGTPEELAGNEPTEEEIRHRAYLRFLERGGGHGNDFDDWLHAERELRQKDK